MAESSMVTDNDVVPTFVALAAMRVASFNAELVSEKNNPPNWLSKSIPSWCCSLTVSEITIAIRPSSLNTGSMSSWRTDNNPPNRPPEINEVMFWALAPLVSRTSSRLTPESVALVSNVNESFPITKGCPLPTNTLTPKLSAGIT